MNDILELEKLNTLDMKKNNFSTKIQNIKNQIVNYESAYIEGSTECKKFYIEKPKEVSLAYITKIYKENYIIKEFTLALLTNDNIKIFSNIVYFEFVLKY